MLNLRHQLEALNDPRRFAAIARMRRAAFNWAPQGRIPLGIHVVNPDLATNLSYADWPAFDFVPRSKNASGLVLYCQVDSTEEGREMWSAWKEAHRK